MLLLTIWLVQELQIRATLTLIQNLSNPNVDPHTYPNPNLNLTLTLTQILTLALTRILMLADPDLDPPTLLRRNTHTGRNHFGQLGDGTNTDRLFEKH